MAVNIYHRAPPPRQMFDAKKISNKNMYARALTYLYNVNINI